MVINSTHPKHINAKSDTIEGKPFFAYGGFKTDAKVQTCQKPDEPVD
ncbi:Uncharacterised protein [Chlamydia abortus]|nr:Uncharacterised protein [Chlamydia abortus]